jgi:hypothetical protein
MTLHIHSYFLLPPHSCPPPLNRDLSQNNLKGTTSHRAWDRLRISPPCESACGFLCALCERIQCIQYIQHTTYTACMHHVTVFYFFLSLSPFSFPLSRPCTPLHTAFRGYLIGIYLVHMALVGSLTLCQVESTNDMYLYSHIPHLCSTYLHVWFI